MNKRKIILLYITITITTIIFISLGVIFNKSELEKLNGLSETFAISPNGDIAYVSYDKGRPGIYLKSNKGDGLLTQYKEDKIIENIRFAQDENILIYSLVDRELDSENKSSIYFLDPNIGKSKKIYETDGIITELMPNPNDFGEIYFLKASSYENYSPVTRKAPHDFDLYRYNLDDEKEIQLTFWSKYSMASLNLSVTEEVAYVQMPDDESAQSAEEFFDVKQKVYEIPLDSPEVSTVVSNEDREAEIYDFVVLPKKNGMIFQSISNYAANETYRYELFFHDWENGQEKQLTNLEQYTGNPQFSLADDKIYFIVNTAFAKKHADHYLFKMDVDGGSLEEVSLKYR